MFNDPFESFHEVVAQAKEEREQLDRLLTISTLRERVLVAASALILLLFAVWLFFGNLTRSVAVDGVLVESGGNPGAGETMRAVVWLDRDIARQLAAGMKVSVELAAPGGAELSLDGEISALAAVPIPGLAESREFAAPAAMRSMEISMTEDVGEIGLVGAECRIVVELGQFPPVSLMGIGNS